MILRDCSVHRVLIGGPLALTLICATQAAFAADSEPALAEVVVTANKRTENAQDVPASVSVQTGEALISRGQTQLADYAAYVPGFDVASGGSPGQASVSLRGISTSANGAAVGTYLDDAPMGASSAWVNASASILDVLPYDLDRLEVLRGPQGTLYGEGSMGGLIKYVLKTPSTQQLEANVGGEINTIDGADRLGYAVRARVNAPLIADKLGVSLSLADKQSPGYMTNSYTGQQHTNETRQYGARLATLWTPNADLSIKLTALTQQITVDDLAVRQFGSSTQVTTRDGAFVYAPTEPLPDLTASFGFPGPYSERINFYSATLEWHVGPFDVVSATSWSSQRSVTGVDFTQILGTILDQVGGTAPGVSNFTTHFGLNKFTQEFRLVSPQGGRIEWLVGAFDTHENSFNNQAIDAFDFNYQPTAPAPPPGLFRFSVPEVFDERAVFGDISFKPASAWKLTGGLRYAHNDQDFDVYQDGVLASVTGHGHLGSREGVFTWMGATEYHFTDDTMAYVRAASGYRPGGPNTPIEGIPPTFDADTLINYELGLKSTFLDRRARVDVAVYRIDWSKVQLVAVANNLGYFANGGKAVSQGLELATQYSPVQGLTLGLNAAYTDAHLTRVTPATTYLLTGYQLPGAPKSSFALTADYDWSLTSRWAARVGGAFRHVSNQWLAIVESESPSSSPTVQAPAYSFLDLNAGLRDEHFNFTLYARNVTNSRAITAASLQGLVVTNSATGNSQINTSFLQPLTIGIGVDYAF